MDANVWNIDIMGFYIRYKIAYWGITINVEKELLLLDPNNREFFITCKSISKRGVEILLILILSGMLILKKWF